jgi:membrane carboxypeptidase/penicillin-binding protein
MTSATARLPPPACTPGEAPRISVNRERVMDAITAYQLTSMMEGVVSAARPRHQPAGADGRQDRHHQRCQGRLVRGLFVEHRGGLLHRL